MTLLQALIRPDREENAWRAEVARAANLLQVGEFQFLQLAYDEWHGREMPEDLINRLFTAYMLHDQAPWWARRCARRVLALDGRGELNEEDPAWRRYDRNYGQAPSKDARRFIAVALLLASLLGGTLWIGHLVAGESASFLPPYFTRKELREMAGEREAGNAAKTPRSAPRETPLSPQPYNFQ